MYAVWLLLFFATQVSGFGSHLLNVWMGRVSRVSRVSMPITHTFTRQKCVKVSIGPVAPKTYEEYCTMLDNEYFVKKEQYDKELSENSRLENPKVLGPPPERMAYEFTPYHPQRLKDWNALVAARRKEQAKQRKLNKDKPPTVELKIAETNFHTENFDFVYQGKITKIANCLVPRWFLVEIGIRKLPQVLASLDTPYWHEIITKQYVPPLRQQLKFVGRGENRTLAYTDIKEGYTRQLFLKMKMNADIEADATSIDGVWRFPGTSYNKEFKLLPVGPRTATELEQFSSVGPVDYELSDEVKRLRIGDYVEIIDGPDKGQYGFILGDHDGDIRVNVRHGNNDVVESVPVDYLRLMEKPPEVKLKELSLRQAVEAVLTKNPNSEMLKKMAKMGVLNEILYSDLPYTKEVQVLKKNKASKKTAVKKASAGLVEALATRLATADTRLATADTSIVGDKKKGSKRVKPPRMPVKTSFASVDEYKQALLDYDTAVRSQTNRS